MNNPFIAILTNGQSSSGAAGSSNSGGSGSTGDNSKNHPLFSQEPWRLYQGAIGHRHVCVELSLLPLQQILTRLFPFGRGAFTPFPLLSRLPAPSPFPPSSFVPPLLFPLLLLCPLSFSPFFFCAPSPFPPSAFVPPLLCPLRPMYHFFVVPSPFLSFFFCVPCAHLNTKLPLLPGLVHAYWAL